MPQANTTPNFREADFELLANTIDTLKPEERELFLTKLVILLIANHPDKAALPNWVATARANLGAPEN